MRDNIVIIGGGLAGLSLSIDLKKRGYGVIVIEKGNYPRHKVCGEYISMESHRYLLSICPQLSGFSLPFISKFSLNSTGKNEFNTTLDLGGFGISRYLLEELLFIEAKKIGVIFMLNCKALDIKFDSSKDLYTIKNSTGEIYSHLVCNASGRKSNFEPKGEKNKPSNTNYIGIKYHLKINRDPSLIEMCNFPGGYCGISNIEDNKSCLCYLVNSEKLKSVHNSIPNLESTFLYTNEKLKKIFTTAEFIFKEPVTISGINFLIKKPVNDKSFYLGDSAGSIAPITGNGMSIALRSSSELAELIDQYNSLKITKLELADNYNRFWNREFEKRIKLSRHLQKLSERPALTNLVIGVFNLFPRLASSVIKQTHGNPF